MTDLRLRDLERRARAGDVAAQAERVRLMLRTLDRACATCGGYGMVRVSGGISMVPHTTCGGTGRLLLPLVELAAYCRAEWARVALSGWPCCHFHAQYGMREQFPCVQKPATLPSFVGGLLRWSDTVRLTAASAALRFARPYYETWRTKEGRPPYVRGHRVSTALQAWLEDQTTERWVDLALVLNWPECRTSDALMNRLVKWASDMLERVNQDPGSLREAMETELITFTEKRLQ